MTPEYLYLTTTGRRTGRPREIEIWFTWDADRYYLVSELRQRAQWVRNVLAEPCVQWRVGTTTLVGCARVLGESADRDRARAAQARSRAKYGWGEGLVVELTPDATPCEAQPAVRGAAAGEPSPDSERARSAPSRTDESQTA